MTRTPDLPPVFGPKNAVYLRAQFRAHGSAAPVAGRGTDLARPDPGKKALPWASRHLKGPLPLRTPRGAPPPDAPLCLAYTRTSAPPNPPGPACGGLTQYWRSKLSFLV